jgi:mRNA deadenylase 3'-5' endonuclease subunit Ccr4
MRALFHVGPSLISAFQCQIVSYYTPPFHSHIAKVARRSKTVMSSSNRIMDNNSSWRGHVVARNLPKGLDPNYEQQHKAIDRQVDPAEIERNSGPAGHLHLRRTRPRVCANESRHLNRQEENSFADRNTDLGVYLYQNDEDDSIFIQMQRSSDEPLTSTLKRLQINISKRLKRESQKDAKNYHEKKPASSRENEVPVPSIWTVDQTSGSLLQERDLSRDCLSGTLWEEAATTPLAILLSLPEFDVEPLWIESRPPTVTGVRTFDDFEACLFPQTPVVVELDLLYSTHAIVDWYANEKLVKCDSHLYVPTEDDVDKELTVLIRPTRADHDGMGFQEAYRFVRKVEPLPANLLLRIRPEWTQPRDSDGLLRVVSYNILADQNCDPLLYPYCKSEYLAKRRRMPLIVQELVSYQPDIICLQEVDDHIFARLLQPVLKEYEYEGYFSCKASGQSEGCALFWSTRRFEQISDRQTHVLRDQFPFTTPSENEVDDSSVNAIYRLIEKRPDLREHLFNRLGHIIQLAGLCDRVSGHKIWVVNTHLFYHAKGNHIRTLQMWALCRQLLHTMTTSSRKDDTMPRAIICGDFNSNLENSCGKLLVDRKLPINHRYTKSDLNTFHWDRDLRRDDSGLPGRNDDFPALSLPNNFPQMRPVSEPPAFTHLVQGFEGRLDHVVVSSGLRPIRNAPMPTVDQVTQQTAMPSEHLPSDHVSLICDLEVIKDD